MATLNAKDIKSVRIFYEHIMLTDKEGKEYFMSMEDVEPLLKKQNYDLEPKRTRTWAKPMKRKSKVV